MEMEEEMMEMEMMEKEMAIEDEMERWSDSTQTFPNTIWEAGETVYMRLLLLLLLLSGPGLSIRKEVRTRSGESHLKFRPVGMN